MISETNKIKSSFALYEYRKMTSNTQRHCCNVDTWLLKKRPKHVVKTLPFFEQHRWKLNVVTTF